MTAHKEDHADTDDHVPVSGQVARKRSITVRGKATSIFISDDMWEEFKGLAAAQNMTANRLASIIRTRTRKSLGSAIRMYVVNSRLGGGPDDGR